MVRMVDQLDEKVMDLPVAHRRLLTCTIEHQAQALQRNA